MTWDETFKLVSSIFISIGGGGAIILTLSSWLGKIWAERILSSDRDKYQRQLELIKSNLSSDVERLKSDLALKLEISKRLSENQFHLYNDLWSSLCDLKITGDRLWERADRPNAKKFAEQLKKTESQILRSSLLIENRHYERLKELMDQFSKFQFGKTKLIEMRNRYGSENRPTPELNPQDIEHTITNNREVKEKYSDLINEIEIFFKNRIRGGRINSTKIA